MTTNQVNAREQFLSLVKRATEAAETYYTSAVLLMSDEEYDNLVDQIENLAEEHGWVEEADKLLNQVAAGVAAGGDVTHKTPMLSLSKVNTLEGVKEFLSTVKGDVTVEPKFDGLAVSAQYVNGKLTQLATRGDGTTGESIPLGETSIQGLPLMLSKALTVEVRGEVFLTSIELYNANISRLTFAYDAWLKRCVGSQPKATVESLHSVAFRNRSVDKHKRSGLNGTLKNGKLSTFYPDEHVFANERNAVAGALRNEKREYQVSMSFACYDVLGDGFDNHVDSLQHIKSVGVSPASDWMPASLHLLTPIRMVELFGELREDNKLDAPTDGVVLKATSFAERDRLGMASRSPRWAVAYKYPSVASRTVLNDIEVTIGRTGRLALIGHVKPVLVDGTRISKVSLHNVDWLTSKDIRIGDTVLIRRANDVIPQIDAVVLAERPADSVAWVAPAVCPSCGEEWDKSTLLWRCDSPNCSVFNGILFAAGRECFDWEGLSKTYLELLFDQGKIETIADVFKLSVEDLATLDTGRLKNDGEPIVVGETVAKKIWEQVQKSKNRPFSAVLTALGIRTLGRTFSRVLAAKYGNIKNLWGATAEQLGQVEGIGPVKAELIFNGLRERKEIIKELGLLGVNLAVKVSSAPQTLKNKKIVVSGSVPGYSRTSLQEKIVELGGTASSSVSTSTSFLVADDAAQGNSKFKKAQSLGVKIVSPEEFLKML